MAKIAKKVVHFDIGQVEFEFVNGEVVIGTLSDFPAEMVTRLATHGLSQKLGDSYASAGDKGMTVEGCAQGVRDIIANLHQSVWSAGGGSGTSILAEALARLTGQSVPDCTAILQAKGKDFAKELGKRKDVKSAVADIRAERLRAKSDATPDGDAADLNELF